MSVNYNPKVTTDGLYMYLDASNKRSYPGTGNNWLDLTGRLTAVKGGSQSPTYPQHNCEYFTFNGGITANNYSRFDVANIPSFSQLSVFAWYRTTDTTNSKTILRMSNSDFELSVDIANALRIAAGTNFNDVAVNVTQSNATDGNWHNIGLTFNGQVLIGYFDGIQIGTTTRGSATTTAAGTLRIGTRDDVYAQHFFGDIATVTIYDKVLSRSEILRNYHAIRSRIYDCVVTGGGTDVTPDAVDWVDQGVTSGYVYTNTQTISGINTTITLSFVIVQNQLGTTQYSLNGGSYTNIGGTLNISNGDTLRFRAPDGNGANIVDVKNDSDGGVTLDSFTLTGGIGVG